MIMTMTEQFSVNIPPEIFILDDLINASPSASINVCAATTTQPNVSQPNRKALSSMIDLVAVELAILVSPLSVSRLSRKKSSQKVTS